MVTAFSGISGRFLVSAIASILVASLADAPSANAQALSGGDIEQCSVYNRDGSYVGQDTVCIERKRALLRRYERDRERDYEEDDAPSYYSGYSSVGLCPQWANSGYGYMTTWQQGGSAAPYPAPGTSYDSAVNGRPCIPNPILILPGIR